jgi:hypothetical protein
MAGTLLSTLPFGFGGLSRREGELGSRNSKATTPLVIFPGHGMLEYGEPIKDAL